MWSKVWKGLLSEYHGRVVYQSLWIKLKVHQDLQWEPAAALWRKRKKGAHGREYGYQRGSISKFTTLSTSLKEELMKKTLSRNVWWILQQSIFHPVFQFIMMTNTESFIKLFSSSRMASFIILLIAKYTRRWQVYIENGNQHVKIKSLWQIPEQNDNISTLMRESVLLF